MSEELLSNHQHVIDELTLITGSRGVFDVVVDGELIYSKGQTGRQAEVGEVLAAFEARLPVGFTRYGTSSRDASPVARSRFGTPALSRDPETG